MGKARSGDRKGVPQGRSAAHLQSREERRHRTLRFRTAYIWTAIVGVAIAYAAIVKPWGTDTVPVANAPSPIATDAGTADPSTTAGSPHDPFFGSPAEDWPAADQGVIMPAATKAGSYSAIQVKAALDLAHQYILLTRADPRVLVDHQIQLLTALVDPEELRRPGLKITGSDSILRPTLLAPGNSLAAPIRVNGTVSAVYHVDSNGTPELQVSTNLVWAYALTSRDRVTTGNSTIAVRHDQMTLDLYPSNPSLRNKVFIEQINGYQSNIDCGYADQGMLGLPRIDDPSRAPIPSGTMPTGNQDYQPQTPMNLGSNCI